MPACVYLCLYQKGTLVDHIKDFISEHNKLGAETFARKKIREIFAFHEQKL